MHCAHSDRSWLAEYLTRQQRAQTLFHLSFQEVQNGATELNQTRTPLFCASITKCKDHTRITYTQHYPQSHIANSHPFRAVYSLLVLMSTINSLTPTLRLIRAIFRSARLTRLVLSLRQAYLMRCSHSVVGSHNHSLWANIFMTSPA